MNPLVEYDEWEIRDRTLLEAADLARELEVFGEAFAGPMRLVAIEGDYLGQLSLVPADGYDPESPDEDGPR